MFDVFLCFASYSLLCLQASQSFLWAHLLWALLGEFCVVSWLCCWDLAAPYDIFCHPFPPYGFCLSLPAMSGWVPFCNNLPAYSWSHVLHLQTCVTGLSSSWVRIRASSSFQQLSTGRPIHSIFSSAGFCNIPLRSLPLEDFYVFYIRTVFNLFLFFGSVRSMLVFSFRAFGALTNCASFPSRGENYSLWEPGHHVAPCSMPRPVHRD